MEYRIFSIGENALTIDFGNLILLELNDKVLQLADHIEQNEFEGFIELVPAYSSLTIFFDPVTVRKSRSEFSTVFSAVKSFIENALRSLSTSEKVEAQLIRIPVCYDQEFAPDLEFIAQTANLSRDEVIKIHTSKTYRVFMIGFLPGFAYMGEVDKRIAVPRQPAPRQNIERGSVGIAGKQTGIYPLDSPGGWQIIGKTPLKMFRPEDKQISRLETGNLVEFYDIGRQEFDEQSKIENRKIKFGCVYYV